MPRGVVGRERVGAVLPHLFHVLLQNEFEAVLKWLMFWERSTPFSLALHPWLCRSFRNVSWGGCTSPS